MGLEMLLAQFDGLIQTPADVDKLNGAILQWAIEGRLLPQCPDDEPASVLLERLIINKKELVNTGKIRKSKKSPRLTQDRFPFHIPENWEWVQLGEIVLDIHYGYTASADRTLTDVRLLRITDIQNNHVNWLAVPGCAIKEKDIPKYLLEENDILIARTGGTIGKTYIVEDISVKAVFASYLIRVIPPNDVSARYLKLFLESPFYWAQLLAKSKGTGQPNVNATSLSQLTVPLPPLEEQKRIVARVDELLGQTAVLAQQLAAVEEQRRGMNTAVLHQLTQATESDKSAAIFPLIQRHFDRLYVDAETINELKQAILQLAVQGRLVPQDPHDEDAAVLLERIAEEKKQLGIKSKKLPEIRDGERPYTLPESWEWIRLIDIVEVGTGATPLRSDPRYWEDGTIPWVTSSATNELFVTNANEFVTELALKETNLKLYPKHTLIVAMYGQGKTRGQVSELLFQTTTNQACAAIVFRGCAEQTREYIKLFFQKNYDEIRLLAEGGAQPNLNLGKVKKTVIPLPPLAEQKRIVDKVDELFALCDQLAGQLLAAENGRASLLDAVLAQAV